MVGQTVSAFEKARQLAPEDPLNLGELGHAYAAAANKQEALKVLDDLKQLSKRRYVGPKVCFLLKSIHGLLACVPTPATKMCWAE